MIGWFQNVPWQLYYQVIELNTFSLSSARHHFVYNVIFDYDCPTHFQMNDMRCKKRSFASLRSPDRLKWEVMYSHKISFTYINEQFEVEKWSSSVSILSNGKLWNRVLSLRVKAKTQENSTSRRKKVQVSQKIPLLNQGYNVDIYQQLTPLTTFIYYNYDDRKSNLHQELGTLVFNRVYLSLDLITPLG